MYFKHNWFFRTSLRFYLAMAVPMLSPLEASAWQMPTPAESAAGQMADETGSPAAAPQLCELHVWPSAGLRSVFHGWVHGGIVDGAVTGREGYPPVPKDAIDTALQTKLLSEVDLPHLLELPAHSVIVHAEALESRDIRNNAERLSTSVSPCYAELVVDDVFFQQDSFSGSFLKSLIRFRSVGAAPTPERSFGTWSKTSLKLFPPKQETDNENALSELRTAYKKNIELFAEYMNKPVKKKKN